MQIHALLPLYPDDASRRQLLTQALTQTQADVAALRLVRSAQDPDAALHAVHRAKGTASFLGGDETALRHFDELTRLIRLTMPTARPFGEAANDGTRNARAPCAGIDDATVLAAYTRVERVLQELETVLNRLMGPYRKP